MRRINHQKKNMCRLNLWTVCRAMCAIPTHRWFRFISILCFFFFPFMKQSIWICCCCCCTFFLDASAAHSIEANSNWLIAFKWQNVWLTWRVSYPLQSSAIFYLDSTLRQIWNWNSTIFHYDTEICNVEVSQARKCVYTHVQNKIQGYGFGNRTVNALFICVPWHMDVVCMCVHCTPFPN